MKTLSLFAVSILMFGFSASAQSSVNWNGFGMSYEKKDPKTDGGRHEPYTVGPRSSGTSDPNRSPAGHTEVWTDPKTGDTYQYHKTNDGKVTTKIYHNDGSVTTNGVTKPSNEKGGSGGNSGSGNSGTNSGGTQGGGTQGGGGNRTPASDPTNRSQGDHFNG